MRKSLYAIMACIGVVALFLIDHWQVSRWRYEKSLELSSKLRLCQTRLKNTIVTRFNAVESLAALFVMHQSTTPEQFAHFSSFLLSFNPPVRAIQYADRNTQVTYVYPPKGNEITIKEPMILLSDPKRGPFTEKAIRKKTAVVQGPFELRQGGKGVVLRFPIYSEGEFLGLSIGVYDIPVLVSEALGGLDIDQLALYLKDKNGIIFWNTGTVNGEFQNLTVPIADTQWTIAARWNKMPKSPVFQRIIIWILGLAFIALTFFVMRFLAGQEERLESIVEQRTNELSISNRALRRSERKFRTIFEQAAVGVALVESQTGRFLRINQRYAEMVGYTVKEMSGGKTFQEITHPDDLQSDLVNMKRLLDGELREFTIEKRYFHKNGSVVWANLTVSSTWQPREEPDLHIAVVEDITTRKNAEESLFKATETTKRQNITFAAINRLFQKAIACQSSSDVARICLSIAEEVTGSQYGSIAEVNSRNRFDTLALSNPGWEECRMVELDPMCLQDMEIRGIWGAALKSENGLIVNDPMNHPLSVGIPEGHPPLNAFLGMPFHHKNFKGLIGIANKEGGYSDNDREILEALAFAFAEVINSKRSEEALRESENKYRLSMEATFDGLWDWNLVSNEVYYSPSWGKMLGEAEVAPNYSSWESRIHPDEKEETLISLQKHLNGESDFWNKEHRVKTRNGRWKWVLGRGRIVERDEAGKPVRMVGTMTDISQLKKVQTQLQQAQKLESIGNLAGGIAHDFNNILASIIGFTELALDDAPGGSTIQHDLQEVYTAAKRARELVKQILTFARQSEEEIKPIQVNIIIKEALHFLRSSIPTSIEIKQNLKSKSLVMGNATQVHQILMNLCTNASQAMQDGGTLSVSLIDVVVDRSDKWQHIDLKQGNYIEIKVSDTGAGISPEIIASIFEPYFTTKGVGEGTGMGLAVVHGIVKSYYGKIYVDSILGKGTEFTIYLPITERIKGLRPYVPEELPTGTESILYVDDEAPIAHIGKIILSKLGYSVRTRTSSIEALELFRANPNDFDLLITDMTMPNLSGDQLAIEFMKIRPEISVILCTGYSNKISSDVAMEIGIKAFAYKPIIKAELAKTVRKVLDENESRL